MKAQLITLYGTLNSLQWGVVGGHYRNTTDNAIYMTVPHGAAAPVVGNPGPLRSAADAIGQGLSGFPGVTANQGIVDPTRHTAKADRASGFARQRLAEECPKPGFDDPQHFLNWRRQLPDDRFVRADHRDCQSTRLSGLLYLGQ